MKEQLHLVFQTRCLQLQDTWVLRLEHKRFDMKCRVSHAVKYFGSTLESYHCGLGGLKWELKYIKGHHKYIGFRFLFTKVDNGKRTVSINVV